MSIDLFAGIAVSDLPRALAWYEALLGSPPTFLPNAEEAVWRLEDHRFVYVELKPEAAGHAMLLLFVEDLEEQVGRIGARAIEPAAEETYDNGVRKVTYRDPDGNEVSFGGTKAGGDAQGSGVPSGGP